MTATKAPRVRWFVWAGDERIPFTSGMMGTWGWDAECACGFGTHTGGGTRRSVRKALAEHKWDAHGVLSPDLWR